jgi:hypothetical protein
MRVAAIIFILLSVTVNFYYNNPSSLVLAMFSFPVLLWLLLSKRKPKGGFKVDMPRNKQETTDTSFDKIEEERKAR